MDFEERASILCGRCRVPVQFAASPGETRVYCPRCGESDTLVEARREASQHTAHKVLSAMLRGMKPEGPDLAFRFVEAGDPWRSAPTLRASKPAGRP